MTKCCEKWAEATSGFTSVGPHALAYPPGATTAQIEVDDKGQASVVGCCANCYVLEGLLFCPWCGTRIASEAT